MVNSCGLELVAQKPNHESHEPHEIPRSKKEKRITWIFSGQIRRRECREVCGSRLSLELVLRRKLFCRVEDCSEQRGRR